LGAIMRVIPVIDLMHGQVVRGVAGKRSEYRPIESRIAADSHPATVAQAFVERFGFETVYVADLDAIEGGPRNFAAWQAIGDVGLKLWLDVGISNSAAVADIVNLSTGLGRSARLVVGLETLESEEALIAMRDLSPQPPVFSLDLKDGRPLVRIAEWLELSPLEIALCVHTAGMADLIVLDLADVGGGGGTRTLGLCRQIRKDVPFRQLIAGGGVRGIDDLMALADAGCDAALVASALHDGRLNKMEIDKVESRLR
jgi:phosphoribosylformimino-5-aminoimidazole carboxamide ribotide isomerase